MNEEQDSPLENIAEEMQSAESSDAVNELRKLISEETCVGDLLEIDFDFADVLIHDSLRQEVRGVPLGCFLLATRIKTDSEDGEIIQDALQEDSSLILLRVIGKAKLPNKSEADSQRFEGAKRATDSTETYDDEGKIDKFTLNELRYSAVQCRILGTFRMMSPKAEKSGWKFSFGTDVSNFYSARSLKVFKPKENALEVIVNYKTGTNDHKLAGKPVGIGKLRYAMTQISDQEPENVDVSMDPTDLVARRTALFGMSRTGKSNTTKIIASSLFKLRENYPEDGRVGQIIFDVNGEYANQNSQDKDCLKNLAKERSKNDVVTYGLLPHPNDPARKIMKLNFLGSLLAGSDWQDSSKVQKALNPLQLGKQLIQQSLAGEQPVYITSFRDVVLETPIDLRDVGSLTRYQRRLLVYRTALVAAGYEPSEDFASASLKSHLNSPLFSEAFRNAMVNNTNERDQGKISIAGENLGNDTLSWDVMRECLEAVYLFISKGTFGYDDFNRDYARNHNGDNWADRDLIELLQIFKLSNGPRRIASLKEQHDPSTNGNFGEQIANDARAGKLVIVDQSLGDQDLIKQLCERIMGDVFEFQKNDFVKPDEDKDGNLKPPPDVIVYIEEAHNLLPKDDQDGLRGVWSRAAKEGSKYRIGMVFATQEPSSIQKNILKNTDNWFVAHLNNTEEVRELVKYYDFEDFKQQIIKVPQPGFLRMRTLSNPFIIPIQVKLFEVIVDQGEDEGVDESIVDEKMEF